jgi:hypothetical protein
MNERDRVESALRKNPKYRQPFFSRSSWSRRELFRVAGGLTTAALASRPAVAQQIVSGGNNPKTKNTAKNVIFIMLAGAPSHTDLFDFKMIPGVTPATTKPETLKPGILWPTGILPKLGGQFEDLAIVRSMRARALVHSLSQTWIQIGRSPVAALGDVAPNIGSIVALEKTPERTPKNVFPTFLALNSNGAVGPGYFDSKFAPFKTSPSANGLLNTQHVGGEAVFTERYNVMQELDQPLRVNSPLGKSAEDMDDFYRAARGLMYNPDVDKAFKFTQAEGARYGNNAFGNACLTAKQVLEANEGTRFIQITLGGWDMHQNIYGVNGNITAAGNIFSLGKILDDGMSTLLADLKTAGLLNETLVVAVGEFGRTIGRLSAQAGRDHYSQQFAVFAGGGVKGGRVIGSTDAQGAMTVDPGWTRDRDVWAEDIEATILSAMGIDWTTIRYDDPFGRGFEYVPNAKEDLYGPINELWG